MLLVNRPLVRIGFCKQMLLASCSLLLMTSVAMGQDFFKMDGKAVKVSEVGPALLQSLHDIEMSAFKNKRAVAEEALLDAHFAAQAKKEGKSAETLREAALKPKDPSEAELKKFYDENKERIPPAMTYDQVKGEIKKVLQQQGQGKARESLVEKLSKQHNFVFLLPEPVAPTVELKTEGRMSKGASGAKVKMVEFADYACGHCRHAHPDIKKLVAEMGASVQYIFIDFPLGNPDASRVARGAFCANKQNKYWEYQDLGFTKPVTATAALDHAKALKLNEKDFNACLETKEAKDFVESGRTEGERVGVNGTPAFYINGKRFSGAPEYKELKESLKAVK